MFNTAYLPTIFAHRGASAHAPENTIAAFQCAVDQGAAAIELDVKLTLDRVPVVIHDPTVDRTTTNGKGRVNQLPLDQLKELDAGSFFSEQYKGEKIPTLEEVFEAVGNKLLINVELTNYTSLNDGLTDLVADLVTKHHLENSVMFSSFFPLNLSRVQKLLPNCPVAILALPGTPGIFARSFIGSWFSPSLLHPYVTDVNDAMIQREHLHNRKVNVWTVNDPLDMARLYEWKVDGIITDDPLLANKILQEHKSGF